MFLALGLDKSLSTTECGDLEENIYEVHWTECSPICSPGQLSSAVEEMISAKKRCLYFFFYFAKSFPRQRAYQWGQYILLWNHISPGDEKLACHHYQYLYCKREVSLYHVKAIHPNIITVRGVMETQITWKASRAWQLFIICRLKCPPRFIASFGKIPWLIGLAKWKWWAVLTSWPPHCRPPGRWRCGRGWRGRRGRPPTPPGPQAAAIPCRIL